MKFIHFTDTHLVQPGELLKGLDPAARLAPCIDDINKSHADAHCCVITGDLADRAEESAYEFLSEQIARLKIPCHLIIGNHDDRKLFCRWFPDTEEDENGFIQYTRSTPAGVFVMLDTVEAGTHGGEFCKDRLDWLSQTLNKHKRDPVFLFMHHPPFDIHLPSIDRIGLRQKEEFAEVIASRTNIRHLFFGHAHRPLSGQWKGISFSSLRGTNHQVGLDFQSAQIIYADEPPEYSVVFVSDDSIVVHSHAYPTSPS